MVEQRHGIFLVIVIPERDGALAQGLQEKNTELVLEHRIQGVESVVTHEPRDFVLVNVNFWRFGLRVKPDAPGLDEELVNLFDLNVLRQALNKHLKDPAVTFGLFFLSVFTIST